MEDGDDVKDTDVFDNDEENVFIPFIVPSPRGIGPHCNRERATAPQSTIREKNTTTYNNGSPSIFSHVDQSFLENIISRIVQS